MITHSVCVCNNVSVLKSCNRFSSSSSSGEHPGRATETGPCAEDRVVVKYLDRRARAPTVNRRPRSGVGGARRGVREYGAVNYHKVELKEQKNETVQQCCSCLERSDDPEQTSSGDTECVVRVDWSRSTWKERAEAQ